MLSDCVYDYGEDNCSLEKIQLVSFLKAILRDSENLSSMLFTYFISEIVLWCVQDPKERPGLVQAGIIQLCNKIVDITSKVLSQDYKMVAEAEINVSQAIARCLIVVNPQLLETYTIFNSLSLLTNRLLADGVHHYLLNYEGLLAFTNLCSFESEIRKKVIEHFSKGQDLSELVYSGNQEVSIAAIEFIANMSSDQEMKKAINEKIPGYVKTFLKKLAICAEADTKNEVRIRFAVLSFMANTVCIPNILQKILDGENQIIITLLKVLATLDSKLEEEGLAKVKPELHRVLYILTEILDSDEDIVESIDLSKIESQTPSIKRILYTKFSESDAIEQEMARSNEYAHEPGLKTMLFHKIPDPAYLRGKAEVMTNAEVLKQRMKPNNINKKADEIVRNYLHSSGKKKGKKKRKRNASDEQRDSEEQVLPEFSNTLDMRIGSDLTTEEDMLQRASTFGSNTISEPKNEFQDTKGRVIMQGQNRIAQLENIVCELQMQVDYLNANE